MTDENDSLPAGAHQSPPEPGGPPSPPARETAPHPRPAGTAGPPPAPMQVAGNVRGDVAARDIHTTQTAGHDVVGRDVVTDTNTTQFTFAEEEISSYFHLLAAGRLPGDIRAGKVRLLDSGQLLVGGRSGSLGGLPFAATVAWQDTLGAPLRLTGALVQVLPIEHSPLGWVVVPALFLRPVENSVNGLFGNVESTSVIPSADGPAWTVMGVGR